MREPEKLQHCTPKLPIANYSISDLSEEALTELGMRLHLQEWQRGRHYDAPFGKKESTMNNEQRPIIIPVKQATISFYGYPVIAVRLSDGRIGAVLRNMCEALQMERFERAKKK